MANNETRLKHPSHDYDRAARIVASYMRVRAEDENPELSTGPDGREGYILTDKRGITGTVDTIWPGMTAEELTAASTPIRKRLMTASKNVIPIDNPQTKSATQWWIAPEYQKPVLGRSSSDLHRMLKSTLGIREYNLRHYNHWTKGNHQFCVAGGKCDQAPPENVSTEYTQWRMVQHAHLELPKKAKRIIDELLRTGEWSLPPMDHPKADYDLAAQAVYNRMLAWAKEQNEPITLPDDNDNRPGYVLSGHGGLVGTIRALWPDLSPNDFVAASSAIRDRLVNRPHYANLVNVDPANISPHDRSNRVQWWVSAEWIKPTPPFGVRAMRTQQQEPPPSEDQESPASPPEGQEPLPGGQEGQESPASPPEDQEGQEFQDLCDQVALWTERLPVSMIANPTIETALADIGTALGRIIRAAITEAQSQGDTIEQLQRDKQELISHNEELAEQIKAIRKAMGL